MRRQGRLAGAGRQGARAGFPGRSVRSARAGIRPARCPPQDPAAPYKYLRVSRISLSRAAKIKPGLRCVRIPSTVLPVVGCSLRPSFPRQKTRGSQPLESPCRPLHSMRVITGVRWSYGNIFPAFRQGTERSSRRLKWFRRSFFLDSRSGAHAAFVHPVPSAAAIMCEFVLLLNLSWLSQAGLRRLNSVFRPLPFSSVSLTFILFCGKIGERKGFVC